MLYLILIAAFGATGLLIYFLFKPAQAALEQNVFRQKTHVARELEQMFIFMSVEGLQKLKWTLATVVAAAFSRVLTFTRCLMSVTVAMTSLQAIFSQ